MKVPTDSTLSSGELVLMVVAGIFTVAMTILFFAIYRMAKKGNRGCFIVTFRTFL